MFQISRHLSVESGPKVSKAGPGSIHVLRPNSVSDFQYRPVLDVKSVGSVPRSNPASTRPESITVTKGIFQHLFLDHVLLDRSFPLLDCKVLVDCNLEVFGGNKFLMEFPFKSPSGERFIPLIQSF